ncbi:MAG: CPBP family intramembrane metalloprotease [Lachnospiraceae bacterium]|nr:CPBP family intramembrane metalloprotease [Lachnospiraceae bacterium]
MKNLLKSYRIFISDMYLILGVFVATATILIFSALGGRAFGSMGIILFYALAAMVDLYGDYFVMVGFTDKKFDFGLLKNSLDGKRVLRDGVLADQIRRALQLLITMEGSSFIIYAISEGEDRMSLPVTLGLGVLAALITFTINTIWFNVTRNLGSFMEIGLVGGIGIALDIIPTAIFILISFDNEINMIPMILVWAILAVVVTYCMVERISLRFDLNFGDKVKGRFGSDSKKRIWIFFLVAFLINYLMVPLMFYGESKGVNTICFMYALMLYPASGVMIGKMFSYDEGKLPVTFYVICLLTTMLMMVMSAASVVLPSETIEMNGSSISVFDMTCQVMLMIVSLILWIVLFASGKEKRRNAGLNGRKWGISILIIVLFTVLYAVRFFLMICLPGLMDGSVNKNIHEFAAIFTDPATYRAMVVTLINFFLTFVLFLGEEYGWRYYLQPIMQSGFGKRAGVLLLGVIWGLWHAGADFTYYSEGCGPQTQVNQIIVCVTIGIFMAYAYMKTENIWVPITIHFINNNLIPVFAGDISSDVLSNNVIAWSDLPVALAAGLVFAVFIFAPVFNRTKEGSN